MILTYPQRECQDLADVHHLEIKEKAVKNTQKIYKKIQALLKPALMVIQ